MNINRISRGLGVAVRFAQVTAPKKLRRLLGPKKHDQVVRLFKQRDTTPIWARIASDAVELSLLAATFRKSRKRKWAGVAIAGFAAMSAIDLWTARRAA